MIERQCAHCGKTFSMYPSEDKKGNKRMYCSKQCSNIGLRSRTTLTCEICGKAFEVGNHFAHQRFCSLQCAGIARRTRVSRKCEQCGKDFEIEIGKIKKGFGKYCSHICQGVAHTVSTKSDCEYCGETIVRTPSQIKRGVKKYCNDKCRQAAARSTRVDCICQHCGKTFWTWPALIKQGRKYCSRECSSAGQLNRVQCKCKQCGREFEAFPAEIKKGGGKYCSPECYAIGNRGAKNINWRGGHTHYRGENWGQQRKLAYERDGGNCQRCHRKRLKGERKFHVHHITPARKFNGDYIAANDLSNLVTLCPQCHKKAENGSVTIPVHLF